MSIIQGTSKAAGGGYTIDQSIRFDSVRNSELYRTLPSDGNLKTGTLAHHIKALIRENLIKEYQDGMYKRFSIYDKSSSSKFKLPNIQDEILKVIKDNPGISQINISELIDV